MQPVIIVFAKAPAAGRVKTRLIPALGAEGAARLHAAMVEDSLANLLTYGLGAVELHTDTETDAWRQFEVPRRLQHEGDLGLKMFHALSGGLARGFDQAVILGSDSPDLPTGHLSGLLALDADVALGPAEDGGYYAIAARRVDPGMFAGVGWGSARALEQTCAACRSCGLSVAKGLTWGDIDTEHDLEKLAGNVRAPLSAALIAGTRRLK